MEMRLAITRVSGRSGVPGRGRSAEVRAERTTVVEVDGEAHNAACDRTHQVIDALNEFGVDEARRFYDDSFVREDRRRMVAFTHQSAEEFPDHGSYWFDTGHGPPTWEVVNVLAVAGTRCAAHHIGLSFETDVSVDLINVIRFDERLDRIERIVSFELDDVDSAIAELHRLQSEIEESPTR